MALTSLTVNPQKITVPANTDDHEINVDAFLLHSGNVRIDNISGPVRFNDAGATDTTNSPPYTTTDKVILNAERGKTIHYRGAAGGETFFVHVLK